MNPKIMKLRGELEKNKGKISDLQGRNRELEKQIRELEDTDIIGMVRELLTSFADEPLAPDNEAYASLKSTLNSLEYSPSHPRYLGTDAEEFERIAYRLDGREYFAGPNTGGLFPQTLQAVHSNMTDSCALKSGIRTFIYTYTKRMSAICSYFATTARLNTARQPCAGKGSLSPRGAAGSWT